MTLFGYTLIKTKKLTQTIEAAERIIEHTNNNALFKNEKNTLESDGNNPTIAGHWNLFRVLSRNFTNARRELK